jgi:hypothetical protein
MSTPTKSSSSKLLYSPGHSPRRPFSQMSPFSKSPNSPNQGAAALLTKVARPVFEQENSRILGAPKHSATQMSGDDLLSENRDGHAHRRKNCDHSAHTISSTPPTGEGRTVVLYFDVKGFETETDQRQTRQIPQHNKRLAMRHMRVLSDSFSSGSSSRKTSRAINMNELVGSPAKKMRKGTTTNPNEVLSPMLQEACISRHSSKQSRPATEGLLSSGSACASSSSSSTQMSTAKIIKVKVMATFKQIKKLGEGDNKSVHRVEVMNWEYDGDNLTRQSIEKLNSIRDNIHEYVLATEKSSIRIAASRNPRKRMLSTLDTDRKVRRQAKDVFGENIIDGAANSPSPRKQMSAELKPLRNPLPTPFILPASKTDLDNPESPITQSAWAEICNILARLIATPSNVLDNTADLKPANCGLDKDGHVHFFDAGYCKYENDQCGLAATLIQWVGDNTVTIGDEDEITIEWALGEIFENAISMSEVNGMSEKEITIKIQNIIDLLIDWKKHD